MIDYKLLKSFDIKPKTFIRNKSAVIVESEDSKYVVKENKDNDEIYEYLLARNFNYFPNKRNISERYDLYEYLEDYNISKEERAVELINLVSILHSKTTRYNSISLDDYKIIYEEIDKRIEYLYGYYYDLNDLIEQEIYMSPSKYLFVRNISKIYSSLNYCRNELDNWYEIVKDNEKERVVLIHNNLELSHLIRNENSYLISWEKAKFDSPIYDLYNFYKKNYNEVDFSNLLQLYQNRYPLKEHELKLFFILISLPEKIEFSLDDYSNCLNVSCMLDYIYETDRIISPYYSKDEEE